MKRDAGFSLLELLLACSLGLLVFGVAASALLSEQKLGSRMGGLLRQRQLLLRANQLIAADVQRGIALAPELVSPCHLAGRKRWLQLLNADGSITTYSIGKAPSGIWQGEVLMRCGPAYGLDGRIKAGARSLNRVVLDGLVPSSQAWAGCSLPQAETFSEAPVCWEPASGVVQWQLQRTSNRVTTQQDGQALLKG
ncbi:Uncharacterized conserved secreted protein, pili subunit superfamily [Synechococcus sp. RCC307]|nr:Uncharacterized conserved secreted protein, pili subunit superfamily [Synechococcus sp. RCC307]